MKFIGVRKYNQLCHVGLADSIYTLINTKSIDLMLHCIAHSFLIVCPWDDLRRKVEVGSAISPAQE